MVGLIFIASKIHYPIQVLAPLRVPCIGYFFAFFYATPDHRSVTEVALTRSNEQAVCEID